VQVHGLVDVALGSRRSSVLSGSTILELANRKTMQLLAKNRHYTSNPVVSVIACGC
jgi:hypothetical protein